MTQAKTPERLRTADVLERYGHCLELVPADAHFQSISVGLYLKEGVFTVWSFSGKTGVPGRLENIRDRLVELGSMEPVEGNPVQVRFACGYLHRRPLKFLLAQAVGRAPDYAAPQGDVPLKDTRSKLMLSLSGSQHDGQWVYQVTGKGEAANPALRLRMIVSGFVRYGEMVKVSDTEVTFPCNQRHDALARLLLPYGRNVSNVESMMEMEATRGQMTTNTLGFSQAT